MEIVVFNEQGRVPVTVFQVQGEITAESYEQLQQQAQEAFEAGTRDLLLDLNQVTFVSSSGLRAVHYIFELLGGQELKKDSASVRSGIAAGSYQSPHLKILGPTRAVRETLRLAGFDMFLQIHSDRQKAIDSF